MKKTGKEMIGSKCRCGRGELKKKYNRNVKPAKPFVGCSNYPRCDIAFDYDETTRQITEISDQDAHDDAYYDCVDYKY
ncbi:hypothetical protein ACX93W_26825 [Paenibacillus sp. CAU 1782]